MKKWLLGLGIVSGITLCHSALAVDINQAAAQFLNSKTVNSQHANKSSANDLHIDQHTLRQLLEKSKRSTKKDSNKANGRKRSSADREYSNATLQQLLNQYARKQQSPAKRKANRYRPWQFKKAVNKARKMINVPYVWGGTSPRGFDCSGLVQYSYKHAGIKLPRTAATQYKATKRVSLSEAKYGDLIFFHIPMPRKVYVNHVAIYLGNNRMLHAPGFGTRVSIEPLDALWKQHVVGVGRPT